MTVHSTLDRHSRFDRLTVIERLGGGIHTDVWLVDGSSLGNLPSQVAIKTLKPSLAAASARGRLMREGEILSELSHPGLVTLLARGLWAGEPALALEFIPAALPVSSFSPLVLARQLLVLCRYLHEQHPKHPIVHGDIRAANLRVRGDGSLVLFDFGSASLTGLPAVEGLGTSPGLARPGRLDGGPPCVADDLEAVGRLLEGWVQQAGVSAAEQAVLGPLADGLRQERIRSASEALRGM